MTLFELWVLNLAVIGGLMLLLWLASLALRDVSIVDVFWGLGFIVIAGVTFACIGEPTGRKWLLLGMTGTWGLRLAVHLGRRKFGTLEDARYRAMRERIGPNFGFVSLFLVFGLQGLIMGIVSLPLLTGQLDRAPLGWLDAAGVAVFSVGLLFETVGDLQLARFKADPANEGKVMDCGLWRYTRHPNYFGDFLVWWGIYLTALGTGDGWWTIVGPLLMSVLLLRVSGVTLLERSLRRSKPGYAEYAARTSSFFPWPPALPRVRENGQAKSA